MPTPPHPDILPANPEPGLPELLGKFSRLLDDVMAFGTHVLAWSMTVTTKGTDENVTRSTMFRRFLELLDGLSAQVARGSTESARVTLRASFECSLSMLYLLEADHSRRALAFLVVDKHSQLRNLEAWDPGSVVGKQLRATLAADRIVNNMAGHIIPDLQAQIAQKRAFLTTGAYGPIEQEFQQMVLSSPKRKKPRWHALFGGPRTVEDLARYLSLGGLYELLYRPLSGATHSSDVTKGTFTVEPGGQFALLQLRLPEDAQFVTHMATSLALQVFMAYCGFYNPERLPEYRAWYESEIRKRYLVVGGKPLLTIKR